MPQGEPACPVRSRSPRSRVSAATHARHASSSLSKAVQLQPLCFRHGSIQSYSERDSHEVPCEPRDEFPSLHRIVIPAALRLILAQPLECRWRRWTSLENVFLALQSKHSQDAKARSNHRLSEAFLSREVGDNPRIKLGEFQFRGGRKTNYFDLELTVRN